MIVVCEFHKLELFTFGGTAAPCSIFYTRRYFDNELGDFDMLFLYAYLHLIYFR